MKRTEGVHRQLGYQSEFKEFVTEHPRFLADLKAAIPILSIRVCAGETLEQGSVHIETFKDPGRYYSAPWYRVTCQNKVFFLKFAPADKDAVDGYKEFVATVALKTHLSELDIEDVEVIEPFAGYSDASGQYFLSQWDNRLFYTVKDHLEFLEQDSDSFQPEIDVLKKRVKAIEQILDEQKFFDTGAHNLAYDPKTKKIIIFDLSPTKSFISTH